MAQAKARTVAKGALVAPTSFVLAVKQGSERKVEWIWIHSKEPPYGELVRRETR